MNSLMLSSFRDEMEKIALLGAFKKLVHEGWHGPAHAPVGLLGKGLMVASTVPMAQQAMAAEDPAGLDRSRPERVVGMAGNLAGGLAGSALAMRAAAPKKLPIGIKPSLGLKGTLAGLAGAIGGSMLGERITTAPFSALPRQPPQQQMQQINGVPA
jgi:hypothetical protein